MMKYCLEIYQSKNYKLPDNRFIDLYDLYSPELGLVNNFEIMTSEISCDTFYITRNTLSEVAILVYFQDLSSIVHINIEDTLKILLEKINKNYLFSTIFTTENSIFSSNFQTRE